MKIIATVNFSAQLQKGDAYELPESDARMLIGMGLARAADGLDPAAPPAEPARSPRGGYRRRDLRPEE